jgi:hypothetical protein
MFGHVWVWWASKANQLSSHHSETLERGPDRLDALHRLRTGARVAIPVEPEVLSQRLPDLPAGIGLTPGELPSGFRPPRNC